MKIAYVTINVAVKIMTGGVGAKIKRQIFLWKDMGHTVTIFSLTPERINFPDSQQFVYGPWSQISLLKPITLELSRSENLIRMIREVREYHPDIIYLRFGLYTFPLHNLFKIAPVLMEVNSNDLEEYRTRGYFFYWLNRLTRGIVFARSTGLVPVSRELAELNLKYNKKTCVVSNGIDLESFELLPAPSNPAPVLTAIGSPDMKWHGMDKLFAIARRFPDLTINIIGYDPVDFLEPAPPNLIIHGYVGRDVIKKILSTTDVMFGTLAMHRKNMKENPALKVREALAFGIPIIMAHPDADLEGLDTDCILFLPNTEDNLITHADSVRDFAYHVIGKRIPRELISSRVDMRRKEETRLAFFEEILAKKEIE